MRGLKALCAAGALLATDTFAAEREVPRIPDWKQSHLEAYNRATMTIFVLAMCARDERREAAETLLRTVPGSSEENLAVHVAVPSGKTECPMQQPSIRMHSMTVMRGAVAEALYNGDRRKPRTDSPLPLEESFVGSDLLPPVEVSRWVAKCAVRRHPQRVHAVITFRPGSVGEAKALRALKPTLIGCLPEGLRLQAARLEFRVLLAEELYQASVLFKDAFDHA